MASERQDIHGLQREEQMSVGPFLFLWSRTGGVCKSWPFSNNCKLMIVPKLVSGYGFLGAFYSLSLSSYLYQVRGRHCESEENVFIYSLTWVDLTVYREWRHFDFRARLKKQNFSSETTELSQSCNRKKTSFCGITSKLTIQVLSSPNKFTRWGSKESCLFSRGMF